MITSPTRALVGAIPTPGGIRPIPGRAAMLPLGPDYAVDLLPPGLYFPDAVEIDPGRLAQEAAFLADRSDISEEIVRAKSHVDHFRHIMDSKEPAGRKLNFLLQELHREFNTMGSKIGQADTSHRIVDVKSELEKIREQIQNVV